MGLSTQRPGVLMYPLQVLTGNELLASILGMLATIPPSAVAGKEPTSKASIPGVSEMPAPPTGMKQLCHSSNQGASMPTPEEEGTVELDITPEELLHQKWREDRPVARPLKEKLP